MLQTLFCTIGTSTSIQKIVIFVRIAFAHLTPSAKRKLPAQNRTVCCLLLLWLPDLFCCQLLPPPKHPQVFSSCIEEVSLVVCRTQTGESHGHSQQPCCESEIKLRQTTGKTTATVIRGQTGFDVFEWEKVTGQDRQVRLTAEPVVPVTSHSKYNLERENLPILYLPPPIALIFHFLSKGMGRNQWPQEDRLHTGWPRVPKIRF